MIGHDILVNRRLSEDEIRDAIATTLGVSPEAIFVFDGDAGPPHDDADGTSITVMHVATDGDFVMLLNVDARTPERATWAESLDPVLTIQRFCDYLGVEAIVDDGTADPYAGLYLRPGHLPQLVEFDVDELDADRYVLVRQPASLST